jgi:hypothetical protein
MLTALFLLGLAIGASIAGARWPLALGLAAVLAACAGTTLPDIDQMLPLDHRSALTHSVLPAALTWRWRAVAAGLALGLGLHLSADLFPNAMQGYATVKLPFAGSIGWQASYLWLAVNGFAALAIGAWLLGRLMGPRLALAVLGAVMLIGIAYLFATDGGWWALTMFGGTGWVALRTRSGGPLKSSP